MTETPEDKISRVRQMASGSETWDLSQNDIAALKYVLELVDSIQKPQPVDDDKSAWISAHGSARLKTLLAEGIEHTAVYRDERREWIRKQLPVGWCLQSDYIGEKLEEPRNSTESDLAMLKEVRDDWGEFLSGIFDSKPVLKYTCVSTTDVKTSGGITPPPKKKHVWCGAVVLSHVHGEPVLFGVPKEFVKGAK